MCGVAGMYQLNGERASEDLLRNMTASLAHRGPDGDGHYINGPIGFRTS